jgi:hypothetical protein
VTEGNLEFLVSLVSLAVTLPGAAAIIVLDERRLRGVQAARAWPAVSRDAALFLVTQTGLPFLLLLLPVHFGRTRRSALGVLMGLGWVCALVAADVGAVVAASAAVDWLGL